MTSTESERRKKKTGEPMMVSRPLKIALLKRKIQGSQRLNPVSVGPQEFIHYVGQFEWLLAVGRSRRKDRSTNTCGPVLLSAVDIHLIPKNRTVW